jgi:uncharacterized protein YjiS (DUF1127 family)
MASHVLNIASQDFGADAPAARWLTLMQRFADWRATRRRRARVALELQSYGDRELEDIGVTRADIPAVVAGTFQRT